MEIVADVHIGIDVGVRITDGMGVIDMKKERREAMTNGEKLQSIFPKMEYEVICNTVLTDIDNGAWFCLDWWNAEYKEPTTKNCESCGYYGLHHEVCNYCYKCSLWTEKESTTKNNLGVDAILRAEVLKIFDEWFATCDIADKKDSPKAKIKALPSVTPIRPKGHWIVQSSNKEQGERDFIWWKCSECGQVIFSETEHDRLEFHAFCGRCGSDNSEVAE